MAFSVRLKLDGLDRVVDRLNRLKQAARGRIQRKAINAATIPVTKDVKARVPKLTGLLKRSIGRKVKTYRVKEVTVGTIGPRTGMGRETVLPSGETKKEDPSNYGPLVEYGTSRSTAKPFMRPAWSAGKEQAEATIIQVCADEIEKEARR